MVRIISALFIGVAALLPVGAGAAEPIRLADDAPDSHVVVSGDTLWSISSQFLKDAWRWPEVWRFNRDEIRNPHLIYPGQVIVLDRSGATPVLRLGKSLGYGNSRPLYEKRFPQVYSETATAAIQSIPWRIIAPFLAEPVVVDDKDDADAGIVVATQEGRVFTGGGDTIFATRIRPGVALWNVYRKAQALNDPLSGEVLGYEASFLGSAQVVAQEEAPVSESRRDAGAFLPISATLQILTAKQEIGKGDRLLPAPAPELLSYVPHAPEDALSGRVVSVYNGLAETGRYNVVAINLGKHDRMEIGHVLALYRNRGEATYNEENIGKSQRYLLPEQRYGLLFVFRVFERVAYALVMQSAGAVAIADSVRTP